MSPLFRIRAAASISFAAHLAIILLLNGGGDLPKGGAPAQPKTISARLEPLPPSDPATSSSAETPDRSAMAPAPSGVFVVRMEASRRPALRQASWSEMLLEQERGLTDRSSFSPCDEDIRGSSSASIPI